ncbi:MAG: D-alanine--D-alanine ligase family protein [Lachnospiraceae bacterium]
MEKKTVVVLFGGQSSEHDISCISAQTVISNIADDKYDVVPVGITKEGQWLLTLDSASIADGSWRNSQIQAIISPDATKQELVMMGPGGMSTRKIDVVFPVLHGLYGEDGTVQGLLELAKIPYVGCGVLASAVSMDKFYTKIIVNQLGIRQAQWEPVVKRDFAQMDKTIERIEKRLDYPVFVKPSNAGSSKGVSKAENRDELVRALYEALEHDTKILVEETILGREIECAVLGGEEVQASGVGEILSATDAAFYDFDAKYHNAESKTVIHPEFPEGVEDKVRECAVCIFQAVDGFGLSRVDFFLEQGTNDIVFNEINTLPGFTSISMYPMLWEAKGIDKPALLDKLIKLAYERR